jgi:hypothetical protein
MPSIGAVMIVCPRFTCACSSCARAWTYLRLGRFHLRLGLVGGRHGRLEIRSRDELFRAQLLGAAQLGLRIVDVHAGALGIGLQLRHRGLGLIDLRLEERRLEGRDHLAAPHPRVEVGGERRDRARNLRADLDGGDGLDGAGGVHRVDDRSARDARRHRRRRRIGARHLRIGGDAGHNHDRCADQPEMSLHDCPL